MVVTREELISKLSAELLEKLEATGSEDEMMQLLDENGISVSPLELMEILSETSTNEELSESDLEAVSGGASNPWAIIRNLLRQLSGAIGHGPSISQGSGGLYGGGGGKHF